MPSQKRKNESICSSLLLRIRNQRRQDAWKSLMGHTRNRCRNLFLYFLVLLIIQCHNRLYNAWKGPFPMTLNQFRDHLETNYNILDYKLFLPLYWFSFQPEYIQIELGENKIDQTTRNAFRIFYGHHSQGILSYIFNRIIEPIIDTKDMTLYVKFAAHEQSYSQKRYSYWFQSFDIKTLRCIVRELATLPTEYMGWPEKSMYIKKIEQIYDANPRFFNQRVIRTCGILIGYLYRPSTEYICSANSYESLRFSKNVRAFNASSSYIPYFSYIFVGVFVYFLCKFLIDLVREIISLLYLPFSIMHPSFQTQMKLSNINSLENLDYLLLNTMNENNHYDRLFIIDSEYLIMFMIDLNENNPNILRRFYEYSPLTIISIKQIRHIRQNHIILDKNIYSRWIDFPTRVYTSHFDPSTWLHQRLMILNDGYRYTWEREEKLQHQKEERQHQFSVFMEEETQYQSRHYGNDISRMLQRITSASPRFIAQMRMDGHQIVTDSLLDTTCRICLDNFQLNQHFGQWPCPGKHAFHFDCLLGVLRAGNTCPLCRHPVEAANLPDTERMLQLLFWRMMPNVFT